RRDARSPAPRRRAPPGGSRCASTTVASAPPSKMASTMAEPDEPAPTSYEQATARVEEIVRRLDSGEAGLRETLELVAEGRRLVEWCAGELEAVGRGLEELRLDELVARLERGGEAEGRPPER